MRGEFDREFWEERYRDGHGHGEHGQNGPGLAVGPWNTVGGVGAGAVGQLGEELFGGLCGGSAGKACTRCRQRGGQHQALHIHGEVSLL